MPYFPEIVVEHILDHLTSHSDRNSASLVNKLWYAVDRHSRRRVHVSNCYAISPERLIGRFTQIRSVSITGRPSISDPNLVPHDWGGSVDPWVGAFAEAVPKLEELRLKRMVVSDECLVLISNSFPNFKSLVLKYCCGFSSRGIAAIASNCRVLERLELQKNEVNDDSGQWLSHFPENCTSLVSLDFSCLRGAVNLVDLERLVARCPNLTNLQLNKAIPVTTLVKVLLKAPQLIHLGFASDIPYIDQQSYRRMQLHFAFNMSKSIRSFSAFSRVPPKFLKAIYPICSNLVFLNMRYIAGINGTELTNLLECCPNLGRLWILDCIGDKGLEMVASTCKGLQELRVYPTNNQNRESAGLTDEGLSAISMGCPRLNSLTYFCDRMTNSALTTLAKNCPLLTCFRLRISNPMESDHTTNQPLDHGFGSIVDSCKQLRKLTLSGLLTNNVFLYIGMYAEKLEVLSVAGIGGSDAGMHYVFSGCRKIRRVEIKYCPSGDSVLLSNAFQSGTMRSLWISSSKITLGACKIITQKMVSLNVEAINAMDHDVKDNSDDTTRVEKLYIYQSLAGPRHDAPGYVLTL